MTAFQDRGVDERVFDAELIALFCRTLDEVEVHGQLDELNVLLRDFARELPKWRLLVSAFNTA